MKITYNKNPLYTTIELDDVEKKEFWYKIKVNVLEDMIFEGGFYLRKGEHFDIEKAKNRLNIEYDNNDESSIDKKCDSMLEYYLSELTIFHSGDCTCVACSCTKCHAESLLGIDTIKGLGKHSAYKIDVAFGKNNEKTIDEALEYLDNYSGIPKDLEVWKKIGGYEQYVPRWKAEAKSAYDWLFAYKHEHLIVINPL